MQYPSCLNETIHFTDFAAQSSLNHVAIIMDGNRRWAAEREKRPSFGHAEGLERAIEVVQTAADFEFGYLTLFAFSTANWCRSRGEIDTLFGLATRAIDRLANECVKHCVRVEVIGRDDRLPKDLLCKLRRVECRTRQGHRCLRIALDYSSRDAILAAARELDSEASLNDLNRLIANDAPPVDLLIRTGKERRLSDFLLWESAFAEIYFSDLYWPEFDAAAFCDAVEWFQARNRRFGA